MLGEAENRVLRRLFTDYGGEDIDTKELVVYLEMRGILTESVADEISNGKTNRERQKQLIRALIRQSTEGLNPLVSFFEENSQSHISEWLMEQIKEIEDGGKGGGAREERSLSEMEKMRIKWMLVSSRVPGVKREVRREGLMREVKEALSSFSDDDAFFVVLHGLPGSGKSSVAAAVVREASLYLSQFDSVVWMMDAHENARDLTHFMADLLVFLKDSPSGEERPPSDRPSIVFLTKMVGEALMDHPNTLIVVDGVMTRETVSWMDHLNVRVLATTRNALLFDDVSQPVKMIKVEGMRSMEVGQMLSQMEEKNIDAAQVERITQLTEGLPHLLKQIHKLTNGQMNKLPYWISRIDRSGVLSLPSSSSYDRDNLSEALESHYSSTPPSLLGALNSLVAFPPITLIPLEILALVIPVDVIDSEDVLPEISLVMDRLRKLGWVEEAEGGGAREVYRVPRIVHEFLLKRVAEEVRAEKRRELMRGGEEAKDEERRGLIREWVTENMERKDEEETASPFMSAIHALVSWFGNLRA